MTLYILNFNNYYNRIIKKFDTITEYEEYIIHTEPVTNFHMNDGISTRAIIGGPTFYNGTGNYAIAYDGVYMTRWFIIENRKTRGGQFEILLKRDVISDYYADVINAPVFIEKATLNNENPLIFNPEDITVNQIKTTETPLRDKTATPWIVGYFSKNYGDSGSQQITAPLEPVQQYLAYPSKEDFPYPEGTYIGALTGNVAFGVNMFKDIVNSKFYDFTCATNGNYEVVEQPQQQSNGYVRLDREANAETWTYLKNSIISKWNGNSNWRQSVITDSVRTNMAEDKFLSDIPVGGKVVRFGTEASGYTYYKIKRSKTPTVVTKYVEAGSGKNFEDPAYTYFAELINSLSGFSIYVDSTHNFKYWYRYNTYTVTYEQLPAQAALTVTIPSSDRRRHLKDAPYDMFAIPYYSSWIGFGEDLLTIEQEDNVHIANAIAKAMGSNLYDIQLLPYCPIQELGKYAGFVSIDSSKLKSNEDFVFVQNENQNFVYSVVFFPQFSEFTFNINSVFNPDTWVETPIEINVTEPKIENQCDLYRLVSPNYNGQFEFSAAKNGGVNYFNIDCSYKPYSPYIHVSPNFKNLYGADFNDARGLICGGDFSLPTISDAWIQYEINNKNYLNTFNRQIENMEVQNKYSRIKENVNIITGAVSGAVSGGMAGSMIGGGYGAGIGAGIGAMASLAGGIADYEINEALRSEAMDYTKDQFGYQLGNIQALPYTLNRVSSFNANNKLFPILEYYTCTDVEKEALRNKIKYNGMSVGTIGAIADYLQPERSYIKGKLIRLEINDDTHVVNSIADELNKGVFI